jgi:hypothetical protein
MTCSLCLSKKQKKKNILNNSEVKGTKREMGKYFELIIKTSGTHTKLFLDKNIQS